MAHTYGTGSGVTDMKINKHILIKDATEKVVSLVSQGVKYAQKCSLIIKYC